MQMKSEKSLFHKTLIIDIETVPLTNDWNMLPGPLQKHWVHKTKFLHLDRAAAEHPDIVFEERGGIYSEFGKIVCIGLGYFAKRGAGQVVRLKTIHGDDEKALLESFCRVISQFGARNRQFRFCGHNIREFDIPYICRRLMVHGIPLPASMNIAGKRPWEVNHLDTLELWRFGDHKSYVSLELLALVLQIPSPKEDMDGSRVAAVYWQEKDLEKIAAYCLNDVYTAALVFLKLSGWRGALPEACYV